MVRSGWRTLVTANHQSPAHAVCPGSAVDGKIRLAAPEASSSCTRSRCAACLGRAGMTASERRWAIAHTALDDWWSNGRGERSNDYSAVRLSVFFAARAPSYSLTDAGLEWPWTSRTTLNSVRRPSKPACPTLNVRSILAVHVAKGRECNVSLFRACIGRWTIAALCSRPAPAVSRLASCVLRLASGVLTRVALAVLAILP
jgi:hypothetical protein